MNTPARTLVLTFFAVGCGSSQNRIAIDAVAPAVVCDDDDPRLVTLSGRGFAPTIVEPVGDEPRLVLPSLILTRNGDPAGADDGYPGQSVSLEPGDGRVQWDSFENLSFTADSALGLSQGSYDITVRGATGHSATRPGGLVVVDPPSLSGTFPETVCSDGGQVEVLLTGVGFLQVGDALPSVTMGSRDLTVLGAEDCEPLTSTDGSWCSSVRVQVDGGAYGFGAHALQLQNPEPAQCSTWQAVALDVVRPPELREIGIDAMCEAGGTLSIFGEGFVTGARIVVGGVEASDVFVVSDTELLVDISDKTPMGLHDVELILPNGCGDVLESALTIESAPDVFYVDPPVMWRARSMVLTAYIADATTEIVDVNIVHHDTGNSTSVDFFWDVSEPGLVRFVVPKDSTAGSYDLDVQHADGCGNALEDAFVATDALEVAIDSVEPAHAWRYNYTALQINGPDSLTSGKERFEEVPSVYLSPSNGDSIGSVLHGITFRSSHRLSAVVPDGLEPGQYDIIIINPSGTIGVLERALTVTEDPPPVITGVSPPSLPHSSDEVVSILGEDFDEPFVEMTCMDAGFETTVGLTIYSDTSTRIEVLVPATNYGEAVCVLTVTNADGSIGRFSALSIRNPAENLFGWTPGPLLNEARRAPVASAGRTSSVSRYVYVIGGDDGDPKSPSDTIERSIIGLYGDLDSFEMLQSKLPAPRTLAAGMQVGRFIYVVGGFDGNNRLATSIRAHILDPIEVPHRDSVSVLVGASSGLSAGRWTYQVSALYDADDETNPGGESLPSEPIHIRVGAAAEYANVTLRWTPVDRAVGYRIYRTPTADRSQSKIEWLVDVDDVREHQDLGAATLTTRSPLIEGAIGEWVELPPNVKQRQSPCLAKGPDPKPDPEVVYLYAAGGLGKSGAQAGIEVLPIRLISPYEQEVGEWRWVRDLDTARYECGGFSVDSSLHSVVERDESWVYFTGGRTSASRTTGAAEAGQVAEGGSLSDWQIIDTMSPTRAGFGVAGASDFLYAFGGQNGKPSAGGVSGELTTREMPSPWNWNSQGVSFNETRYLMGTAQESAVIVVVGGQTSTSDASNTTEFTGF